MQGADTEISSGFDLPRSTTWPMDGPRLWRLLDLSEVGYLAPLTDSGHGSQKSPPVLKSSIGIGSVLVKSAAVN